jgi:WXG100 family type VII secretion target
MTDGLLRVDFTSLTDAVAHIDNAVSTLDTKLSELDTDNRKLVDKWEGSAQQAYFERQQKWTNAANDLKAILQGIKGAVAQSAQDYHTTESNAEKRFR